MKSFPLLLTLLLMAASWIMGVCFLSVIYTPTIILPLFNEYFWVRNHTGLLGPTVVFTLFTAPLLIYAFLKRNDLKRKKTWYSITAVTQLFWVATIALQLKTTAFNLGICH
ncbi:hypothetical protein [Halobacillus litoralis]|uniref:hypothetical protein n=1 Tax=Halobacillus litoralis TaxID=45668 RepID=UPI001CFCBECE|nr:hypothetical protein [Halobacillus litoralis]